MKVEAARTYTWYTLLILIVCSNYIVSTVRAISTTHLSSRAVWPGAAAAPPPQTPDGKLLARSRYEVAPNPTHHTPHCTHSILIHGIVHKRERRAHLTWVGGRMADPSLWSPPA